ncbi:hypothetical protein QBA75_15930 [Streptomyces stelliscabiei]
MALKEIVFRSPGEAERERTARVARARAEARHAAGLRAHPNVVTVHDVLEHGRTAVDRHGVRAGRPRSEGARRPSRRPRSRRVRPDRLAVLDALTAGHDRGIMHRDVKPANILLAPDRAGSPYARVLLTDYGISVQPDHPGDPAHAVARPGRDRRLPRARAGAGPARRTAASDLFSLGCTLYPRRRGVRGPFDRDSEIARADRDRPRRPRPMMRAGALEAVLAAMLAKDPVRRITATETEAALSVIVTPQDHTPPRARPRLTTAVGERALVHRRAGGSRPPPGRAHETPWNTSSGVPRQAGRLVPGGSTGPPGTRARSSAARRRRRALPAARWPGPPRGRGPPPSGWRWWPAGSGPPCGT